MAELTDEMMKTALGAHLQTGESLEHWAIGVKQPSIFMLVPLFAFALIPGASASKSLTKYYLIGLTNHRLIVLHINSFFDMGVKELTEYPLSQFPATPVQCKTGALFVTLKIKDSTARFAGKFAKAMSKDNRMHTEAIGAALSHTLSES